MTMKESIADCQIKNAEIIKDDDMMDDKIEQEWFNKNSLDQVTAAAEKILAIDIEKIKANPFQPRREIADDKIDELAQSIKSSGLIQPIVVRRMGAKYELAAGERRLIACRRLGWQKITATVKQLSDNDMATIALIENLQRENLNFIEEAAGYVSLMDNFKLTQEDLARKLGKSQSTIANKVRLLKLPAKVRKIILENGLTERHARTLLRLDSEKSQLEMIDEIIERGLTVNQSEKRVNKLTESDNGKKKSRKSKTIIKDLRIVLNTIREAVNIIQSCGLYPEVSEKIENDSIEVTIRLTREMIEPK